MTRLGVKNRRAGFSLIEVLVVIAIVGILMSLLFPAVQMAREGARAASCRNRLRQLGLSTFNYESANNRLPSGYTYLSGENYGAETGYHVTHPEANYLGHSWGSQLLTFLELPQLSDRIQRNLPPFDPNNQVTREQSLPLFLCPSDHYSQHNYVVRNDRVTPIERYAASSFVANWGSAEGRVDTPGDITDDINLDATPTMANDVYYRNSATRLRDLQDGTSNTLAFGERTNGPIFGNNGLPLLNGEGQHAVFETSWYAAVRDIDNPYDDHGHMVLFDGEFAPNRAHGDGVGADRGVSAPHFDRAYFTLCDGAVIPISRDVHLEVYRAYCTRDGQEFVSLD